MSKTILHTESSNGWGGQEMRILKESIGMRERGYTVIIGVVRGGKLIERARAEGFEVVEIDFDRKQALKCIMQLIRLIKTHNVEVVNTHSSLDAWLGGIAARIAKKKVVRTRHLSTPSRGGLNSYLLFNRLADQVVTTSSGMIPSLMERSKIGEDRCRMVATGVEPETIAFEQSDVDAFRKQLGVRDGDCLVGTACIVRSWKGIRDFLRAAHLLCDIKQLKWVVIGGGYVDEYKGCVGELGLEESFFFTDHLEDPYPAVASLDVFALLSTAHEGVSQALLQAAYLEKPLVATTVGGSPEVCLHEETGLLVPPHSPKDVAAAVLSLFDQPEKRVAMGKRARALVENKFTMKHTLDQMEGVYGMLR